MKNYNSSEAMEQEIKHMIRSGMTQLTVASLNHAYKELGYVLDRTMDCYCMASYEDGMSYPYITTGVKEIDTNLSAFHYQARRDDNFKAMQQLRKTTFAVTNGAILSH